MINFTFTAIDGMWQLTSTVFKEKAKNDYGFPRYNILPSFAGGRGSTHLPVLSRTTRNAFRGGGASAPKFP